MLAVCAANITNYWNLVIPPAFLPVQWASPLDVYGIKTFPVICDAHDKHPRDAVALALS
jgi:hypothetical protein